MIKGSLLIGALAASCFATTGFAQSMTAAEQEVLQIREKMAHSFMAAIKAKDVSPIGDHYTKDAVFSSLMPARTIFLGREAIVKRYEDIFRAGSLISYESKPDEVHLVGDGIAWSTGTYTYTTMGKDGIKQKGHGSWLDMMKRETDGEWRISGAAYANAPD